MAHALEIAIGLQAGRISTYQLLNDAYEGEGGFADGTYLVRHKREVDDNYLVRRTIAYYLNYVAPVINSHVDPIFRGMVKREMKGGAETLWAEFVKDTDMAGTGIAEFMKSAALCAKLDGVTFIVMDNVSEVPGTLKQAIDERRFPYVYTVGPEDVTNYRLDRFGRIQEFAYEILPDSIVKGKENDRNVMRWTADEWEITDKEGKRLDGGINPLGRVPIVPLFSRIRKGKKKKLLPQSEFYNIAQANLRLFNMCSELDELLRGQCFAILIYPSTEAKDLTVGVNNALGFDGETSKHPPSFIAPPADSGKLIQDQIRTLVTEIYRMAKQSHQTGTQQEATDQASGRAKAWDFESANTALNDFALNLEASEKKIADLFYLWTGTQGEYSCEYPDDFSLENVMAELDEAIKALDMAIGGKFDIAIKKRTAMMYLSDMDADEVKEILDDIETRAKEDAADQKYGQTTDLLAAARAKKQLLGGAAGDAAFGFTGGQSFGK